MTEPIISWYEGENKISKEIKGVDVVNYGTVDSDSESPQKVFYIWNNRNSLDGVSKMEEVTFTTKDRSGGTGDTPGNIVEAVKDNWINVRVDSLDEDVFLEVGKAFSKPVGTNGSTTNPNAATAQTWATGVAYDVGDYVKPTLENNFIYKVTVAGTTGASEPTWSTTTGNAVTEGGSVVEYTTIPVSVTPAAQEILGLANTVNVDGSDATKASGNFIKLTAFADVPPTASSGRNLFVQRI